MQNTQQLHAAFLEGFTKAAIEAGVSVDQLPQLMKFAVSSEFLASNKESFISGFGKAAQPVPSYGATNALKWLSGGVRDLGRSVGWKGLGLLGLGGLGYGTLSHLVKKNRFNAYDPDQQKLLTTAQNIMDSNDPQLINNMHRILRSVGYETLQNRAAAAGYALPAESQMFRQNPLVAGRQY